MVVKLLTIISFFTFSIQNSFSSPSWENILLTYDYHFKGVDGLNKLTSPEGEKIINNVQNYISNPKNKEKLETEDGKILLKNHQKFLNFLASKNTLDNCQNNKSSKRKLEESITLGILQSETQEIDPCRREFLTSFQLLGEFYNSVNNIANETLKPTLQDMLYENSLLNTTEALLKNKMRYDPNFFKNGFDKAQASEIFRSICTKKIYCSDDMREKVKQAILKTYNKNKESNEKVTPDQLLEKFNGSIGKMNKKLNEIELEQTEGFFADTFDGGISLFVPYILDSREAKLQSSGAQNGFSKYLQTYLNETSTQDGLLMHTSSIREKMGPLRTDKNQDDIDEDTKLGESTYRFVEHEELERDDIEDAIEDMYEGINFQVAELQKQNLLKQSYEHQLSRLRQSSLAYKDKDERYQKSLKKNLRYLVKTNPRAVSQVLANNPEYASLVCEVLMDIDRVDSNLEGNESAFLWGGAVLGVAGLLTGGVAWLGAGLLTAGTAATLGTVSTGLIIASTASSVAGGTIAVTQAINLKQELSELETGMLTGNNYVKSSEQMRDFYTSYKNAFYEATINTSMSVAGLGALAALNRLGKAGAVMEGMEQTSLQISGEVMKDLGDIYRVLAKDSKSLRLLENTVKKLGPNGQKDLDEFLGKLAFLPKDMQEKFLATLATLGPNSDKVLHMIKQTKCR